MLIVFILGAVFIGVGVLLKYLWFDRKGKSWWRTLMGWDE
jgi:hypothetical protein